MKKLFIYLLVLFMFFTSIPLQSIAGINPTAKSQPLSNSAESAQATSLIIRLNEIKDLDKSKLNSSEKKQLRKEVKSIKSQLKVINGGVYLSVGAIIIIILLLILIL